MNHTLEAMVRAVFNWPAQLASIPADVVDNSTSMNRPGCGHQEPEDGRTERGRSALHRSGICRHRSIGSGSTREALFENPLPLNLLNGKASKKISREIERLPVTA